MLITPFVTFDTLYVYGIDTSMKLSKTFKVYIGDDSLGTRFNQAYTYKNFVIIESTNGGSRNYGAVSVINFETGSVKRIYDYESNKNYRRYVVEGEFITLPTHLYHIETDSSTLGSYALTGERSSGDMFHGVSYPNVNAGYVNKACYDSFSVLEYGKTGNKNYKRVGNQDCQGWLTSNFPRPMIAAFANRFIVYENGTYYFYKASCGDPGTWHSDHYTITTPQGVNLSGTPIVVPYDSAHFYLYQFRNREASFWSYEKGLIRSYKFPEIKNIGTIDLLAPIGQRDTLVQTNQVSRSVLLVDTTNKQLLPKGYQNTWPEIDALQLLFYPDIKLIVSVNNLYNFKLYEFSNDSINTFGSGINGLALGRDGGNFKYIKNNEVINYSLSALTSTSTGKNANYPFSNLVDIYITPDGNSYLLFDAGGDNNFGGVLKFIASQDSFEVVTHFKGGFQVEQAIRLSVTDSTISISANKGGGLNSGGSVWTLNLMSKVLTKIFYTPSSSATVHGNTIKLGSLLYFVSKKPVVGHYNTDFVLHEINLSNQAEKEIPLDYVTLNRTLRSFLGKDCEPIINDQPSDTNVSLSQNAAFDIGTSPSSGLTFQWQIDMGTGFQTLTDAGQFSGTKTKKLLVSNVTTANENQKFRCIVNDNDCSDTSDIVILTINTASINYIQDIQTIHIYPNPTQDMITISVDPKYVGTNFAIASITGEKVFDGKIENADTKINIKEFAEGLYFIQMGTGIQQSFKIMKQ